MLWPERLTSTRRVAASRAAWAITQRSISGARWKRSACGRNVPGMTSWPSSSIIRTSSSSCTRRPLEISTIGWPCSTRRSSSMARRMRTDHSSFALSVSSRSRRSVMSVPMPQTP